MLYKCCVASRPLDEKTVFKKRKLCDSVPPDNISASIITWLKTKHISILSGTSSVFMEAYILPPSEFRSSCSFLILQQSQSNKSILHHRLGIRLAQWEHFPHKDQWRKIQSNYWLNRENFFFLIQSQLMVFIDEMFQHLPPQSVLIFVELRMLIF